MRTDIDGKRLIAAGFPEGKAIGLAKTAAGKLQRQGRSPEETMALLTQVRESPERFAKDRVLGPLAAELVRLAKRAEVPDSTLRPEPLAYRVWGPEQIEEGAHEQMRTAMRLPVAVAGALLPDAHQGYGLPIGGVLATEDAVIPYAVGVDIACRMRLSIYPLIPEALGQDRPRFRNALLQHTYFGPGVSNPERPAHAVLDDEAWNATRFFKGLQPTAVKQLGTSGSGNHFVEWGELEVTRTDLGIEPGRYLALLSHSGSRGIGHKIATHYSQVATDLHRNLDPKARHLAWLDMDSEWGQEYWTGMNLAGRFASANHWIIHHAVAQAAGLEEIAAVENHHNFAWQERHGDRDVIVHRKGATPAGPGVLGIIPGSMGDPGFVVTGKGDEESLQSASHGAGRVMSRKQAFRTITKEERDRYLAEHGVELLGAGLDESPQVYKRIEEVMAVQNELVDVVGTFRPRMVKMAHEADDI